MNLEELEHPPMNKDKLRWNKLELRCIKTEGHNDRNTEKQEYEKTEKKTQKASRRIPRNWYELICSKMKN